MCGGLPEKPKPLPVKPVGPNCPNWLPQGLNPLQLGDPNDQGVELPHEPVKGLTDEFQELPKPSKPNGEVQPPNGVENEPPNGVEKG